MENTECRMKEAAKYAGHPGVRSRTNVPLCHSGLDPESSLSNAGFPLARE